MVTAAELQVVSDRRIQGSRKVNKWAPDRQICFATELSETPQRIEVFADDKPVAGRRAESKNIKLQFTLHLARP